VTRRSTRPLSAPGARPAPAPAALVTRHAPPPADDAKDKGSSGTQASCDAAGGVVRPAPPRVAVVASGGRRSLLAESAAARPTRASHGAGGAGHSEFSGTVEVDGAWGPEAERQLALQLAAVLSVQAGAVTVATRDVRGAGGRGGGEAAVEVRVKARDPDEVTRVLTASARDPRSELWSFTDLQAVCVAGAAYEKTAPHGSPPRADVLAPAAREHGLSPLLAAQVPPPPTPPSY